jgi:HEAT repeat protein
MVKDEQARVRKAAVSAIGLLHEDPLCLQLVEALTDEDPDVRMAVAEVLGNFKKYPDVLNSLVQAVNDEDIWVQCAVIKAISRIDPGRAVAVIRDMYQQAHELLLISCLQVLGTIGGGDARSIIEWALDSPEVDVVRQARISLEQVSTNTSSSGSA